MNNIPNLTEDQKNFLSLLYDKKRPVAKKDLSAYSSLFSLSDALSLIDSNTNLVCLLGKGGYNEHIKITAEGKAVVEAIRKQNSDEIYKRDLDRRTLEIAEQANAKSDKSNKIALISAVCAGVSIIADILLAVFK